jgi:uncharacterized alkaline shock family protein YloU
MKTSYVVLIIIGALVFLMLGCFLFFGVLIGLSSLQDAIKDVERLYAHRILAGLVGFFFLCVGYYAVKTLIKRSSKDEIFVVDSDYGRTSISLAAIKDLVKKTLRKYENIKRYKLKITIRNKVLNVQADMILWMGKSAAEIIEEIQAELKKKLTNFVGLTSNNMNIDIKVTKVVESKEKETL